ncbi:hypothetical protein Stsp02_53040 [Streptomyces sp. NBRC 14336]|nr:hypothetical protein Stsp02_53040 [Streptomyces sp. NBRC 14336]
MTVGARGGAHARVRDAGARGVAPVSPAAPRPPAGTGSRSGTPELSQTGGPFMRIRIITKTEPAGRIVYRDESRRARRRVLAPPLGLAGVENDPGEPHIVRSID